MKVLTPIVTVLKSAQFDSKAFKVIPLSKAKTLKKGMKIELHPAMHTIDFVCYDLETALRPFTHDEDYEYLIPSPTTEEIKSQPFYKEFATYPPCTIMHIGIVGGGLVKNYKGVTVENVIKRSIRLWNKKPDKSTARILYELNPMNTLSVEELKYINLLGRHTRFEQWSEEPVEVDTKGRLRVKINPIWQHW